MIEVKLKKITKITSRGYKGKVYNINVDDTHTYTINDVFTKNSGGGSLVNYCLGITKIDPLEHDLIFERFLNADRGHLPEFIWVSGIECENGINTKRTYKSNTVLSYVYEKFSCNIY